MRARSALLAAALLLAAPAVRAQVIHQGKTVSLFGHSLEGGLVPLATDVTLATVPLPSKYRSKKHALMVTASLQEACTTGHLESVAQIGDVFLQPDPTGEGGYECSFNGGFEFRTRQWFLPPESAGGPAIPPGSNLVLTARSNTAEGVVSIVTVRIEIAK
jgi:hypothetical protein